MMNDMLLELGTQVGLLQCVWYIKIAMVYDLESFNPVAFSLISTLVQCPVHLVVAISKPE